MEARFTKLREERAKNSVYTGYKAHEDAWVNMTQEEIDYYRSKITPEERYQTIKEMYYFHDSSGYMNGGNVKHAAAILMLAFKNVTFIQKLAGLKMMDI